MVICIDIGNTTIEVGLFDKDNLVSYFKRGIKCENLEQEVNDYFADIDSKSIEYVVYSSVVPEVDNKILQSLKDTYNCNIINVNKNGNLNFEIKVNKEQVIGSDLLADIEGASERYNSATLIFDLGTAIKVLLLDKNKAFTSALILPGIAVSLDSLIDNASLLKEVKIDKPKPVLECVENDDAIKSGVIYSHTSMIDGIIDRYEKELGYKVNAVLTGGDAEMLKDYVTKEIIFDEHLLLYGLNRYGKDNK